jgi:hypothetical protein
MLLGTSGHKKREKYDMSTFGFIKPLKMDLTKGSETSANINQTPVNHPKVDLLSTEHGESLKSTIWIVFIVISFIINVIFPNIFAVTKSNMELA